MLVVAIGAVVEVLLSEEVPLNAGASAVVKVGSELSEESLQAVTNKNSTHATPAISCLPAGLTVIRLLDLGTSCYSTQPCKTMQEQLLALKDYEKAQ